MGTSADRVARNNATFRDANERIRRAAESVGADHAVPFLCECAEETCTAILLLPLDAYAAVRGDPGLFVHARGHDDSSGPHAEVVARRDGYDVVRKVGRAAELAAELDAT